MIKEEYEQASRILDLKNIKLFHMEFRVGIDHNLFADVLFKFGNKQIFFTQKKFGNSRIDPERQTCAVHVMSITQNLTVDIIANGLSGNQVTFTITVKTRLAKNPG